MDKDELYQIGLDFKLNRNKYSELLNKKKPTWSDLNDYHNLPFPTGEAWRQFVKVGQAKEGTLPTQKAVKDAEIEKKLTKLEEKEIELKKERIRLSDVRTKLNAQIRKTTRYENLIEEFKGSMETCDLKEFVYVPVKFDSSNKSMIVCWSDFHYGLSFLNSLNTYNIEVFKRRFEEYLSRVYDIGKQHKINTVYILGLGDYISGQIHGSLTSQNTIDAVRQTQEVSEYMANALYEMSKMFNAVHFYSVIGNHGRAIASKDDNVYSNNFEKIVPWYIKSRLSDIKNVFVHDNEFDEGIGMIHPNNQNIVFSHGDFDKTETITASLSLTVGTIPTDIYVGHKHHFQSEVVNGVNVIMSGSLCGTDDYAKNLRRTGTACQTVAIYNDSGLECIYNVNLQ